MHKVELVFEFETKEDADYFEDLVDEAFEKASMRRYMIEMDEEE